MPLLMQGVAWEGKGRFRPQILQHRDRERPPPLSQKFIVFFPELRHKLTVNIRNQICWVKNEPPPWKFSEISSKFGGGSVPQPDVWVLGTVDKF